ncbi:MAG: hypothetical protein ACI8UO_004695 [Verrucomicrobiales bacterium]|jgi:hypothetical protein
MAVFDHFLQCSQTSLSLEPIGVDQSSGGEDVKVRMKEEVVPEGLDSGDVLR